LKFKRNDGKNRILAPQRFGWHQHTERTVLNNGFNGLNGNLNDHELHGFLVNHSVEVLNGHKTESRQDTSEKKEKKIFLCVFPDFSLPL